MQKTAALEDLTEAKERLDVKSSEESFKWLTEHSRNFLASGYLSPGISAEERIHEIAENAEKILGIPGLCR